MADVIEEAARTWYEHDARDTVRKPFPWDHVLLHAVREKYRRYARALSEAGLLADGTALAQAERSRESQRNVADLAHALVTESDADLKTAGARIDAALAELDRCALEGYWSGTLVERIRKKLLGTAQTAKGGQ